MTFLFIPAGGRAFPSGRPLSTNKASSSSFWSAQAGDEPYAADFGCVGAPSDRGSDAGVRQGRFWSTVVAETYCPCDTESGLLVNNVLKPTVDVVLAPSTMQTFRQILKLDFPAEDIYVIEDEEEK